MSRNHDLPAGRPLPPSWKFKMTMGFFRKFTWIERLQIALGFPVKMTVEIATEHSTGRWTSRMELATTKRLDPEIPNQPVNPAQVA